MLNRRSLLGLLLASPLCCGQKSSAAADAEKDWVCPMDADVRASSPGVCPRCGMKLALRLPERKEFGLQVTHSPQVLKAGTNARLTLRVIDPETHQLAKRFSEVHEKLIHLFVVSENLESFAHIHPELQPDGSFTVEAHLPYPGMYRLLADFYPTGSVPQLALGTFFAGEPARKPKLVPALAPCQAANLRATLQLEPDRPCATLESRLIFALDPASELERYLGAWGHMLVASEDLIDLLHVHPFLVKEHGSMQFNVIFPRPGLYRVWTQFQRAGQVNTTVFTVPVRAL